MKFFFDSFYHLIHFIIIYSIILREFELYLINIISILEVLIILKEFKLYLINIIFIIKILIILKEFELYLIIENFELYLFNIN